MARQPRIVLPGRPHVLIQSTKLAGTPAFIDDHDRRFYLSAMHECARSASVAIHAYALANQRVQILATPQTAEALGRFMQHLGRRYVASFNHRHQATGRLWQSRFGSVALLSEQYLLAALLATEQLPVRDGCAASPDKWTWSSALHHLGSQAEARLTDPVCYWDLGNTPFERQADYAALLKVPMSNFRAIEFQAATRGGWPLGSAEDLVLAQKSMPGRPLKPMRQGRPRKLT